MGIYCRNLSSNDNGIGILKEKPLEITIAAARRRKKGK